jgi:hypothetical protein
MVTDANQTRERELLRQSQADGRAFRKDGHDRAAGAARARKQIRNRSRRRRGRQRITLDWIR